MAMTETTEAIRRHVVVPTTPERAFAVFTEGITRWWPADRHLGRAPIEEIVIEPWGGGRWYTRHADGSESSTGFVAMWDPPARLVLTWQINGEWNYDPDFVTYVELRFLRQADGTTRVELEHRGLEAYGAAAQRIRGVFDSDQGWSRTLGGYAAATIGG
jgi:uncharacterized protein YndB with AHSA1/START domain